MFLFISHDFDFFQFWEKYRIVLSLYHNFYFFFLAILRKESQNCKTNSNSKNSNFCSLNSKLLNFFPTMEYKIKKVIVTFFIVSFICHNSDFFLKIAKKQKNKKKSQICKTNSELRDIKWKFGKKILQFQVNILTIVFLFPTWKK